MAQTYIWKPSTVNSWKKGPTFLAPSGSSGTPKIIAGGKTYEGKFVNDHEGRKQWVFPSELINQKDLQLEYGGQTSSIPEGNVSHEGSNLSGFNPRAKGSVGAGGNYPGASNAQGGSPGGAISVGEHGFTGAFVPYPSAAHANFDSIPQLDYQPIDPMEFSKKYGEFNRGEIDKNFDLSQGMALDALDTELTGMAKYVPQLTALKTAANSQLGQQWRDETQKNENLRGLVENFETDRRLGHIKQLTDLGRTTVGLNEEQRRSDVQKLTDQRYADIGKFSDLRRSEIGKNEAQRRSDIAALSTQREADIGRLSDLRRSEISKNEGLRQAQIRGNIDLQRETVVGDNALNQAQRDAQLKAVMPNEKQDFLDNRGELLGQRGNLLNQRTRAETYASGRAPDDVTNAALELNTRSSAADRSSAGGFGANSSVARKSSDLMSAGQRLQLAQYGENLLGTNINLSAANTGQVNANTAAQAQLELAPTEYLNSAQQVRVEPGWSTEAGFSPDTKYSGDVGYSTDAGFSPDSKYSGDVGYSTAAGFNQDVTYNTGANFNSGSGMNPDSGLSLSPSQSIIGTVGQNLSTLNNATMLAPGEALNSSVQQSQYGTNLKQRTNEFNAEGEFNESKFNAGADNTFAQAAHANEVGFNAGVAGAATEDHATGLAIDQQTKAGQAAEEGRDAATTADNIEAGGAALGALAPILQSVFGSSGGQAAVPGQASGGLPSILDTSSTTASPSGISASGQEMMTIPSTGQSYASGVSSGGPPGSIVVPEGGSIPSGYSGAASADGGGTIAIPSSGSGGDGGGTITTPGDALPGFSFGVGQSGGSDGGNLSIGGGGGSESGGLTGFDEGSGGGDFSGGSSGGGYGGEGGDFGANSGGGDYGIQNAAYTPTARVLSADPAVLSGTFRMDGSATRSSGKIDTAIQKFSDDTGVVIPLDAAHPVTSMLSNGSKGVLGAAGIYSEGGKGRQDVGLAVDGSRTYADSKMLQNKDAATGAKFADTLGQTLAPLGVFSDPQDSANWQNIKGVAGDTTLQADLTAKYAAGDKKGFVDTILEKFKQPKISEITKAKGREGLTTAFSAYQLYNNWDRMSDGQKGLSLAATGMQGFKFATGEDLGSKYIVKPQGPNDLSLTVKEGLGLMQSGVNVYGLVNNWGQLNTMQKIIGGSQTTAQMAQLAQSHGLLGEGTNGAAVKITPQQLAASGFSSAPQQGVGAITGGQLKDLPKGYVVSSKNPDGTITAIPKANSGTAVTTALGAASVGIGTLQVYQNWGRGGVQGAAHGAIGGSAIVGGFAAMGQTNPYLQGAIMASSVLGGVLEDGSAASTAVKVGAAGAVGYGAYQAATGTASSGAGSAFGGYGGAVAAGIGGGLRAGQVLDSDMSAKDKAAQTKYAIEDTVAAYYTFGLSAVGQIADQKLLGGKIQGAREKWNDSDARWLVDAPGKTIDYVNEKIIGAFGSGKGEAQVKRDSIRTGFQKAGFVDDKFNITLADGSKANIGIDGDGDTHQPANPALLSKEQQGKVDKMHSYDIDYTNDLDYASGMAGVTLSRLMVGGKGQAPDQMGGQLGNAALKSVGYGQAMTPENYGKVMANQRAIYAQSGIKSKEAAMHLVNQAFHDGRMEAADLITAQQAVSMVFDNDSYANAQKLMGGRHAGIQAVSSEAVRPKYKKPEAMPKATPGASTAAEEQAATVGAAANSAPAPKGKVVDLLTKERVFGKGEMPKSMPSTERSTGSAKSLKELGARAYG